MTKYNLTRRTFADFVDYVAETHDLDKTVSKKDFAVPRTTVMKWKTKHCNIIPSAVNRARISTILSGTNRVWYSWNSLLKIAASDAAIRELKAQAAAEIQKAKSAQSELSASLKLQRAELRGDKDRQTTLKRANRAARIYEKWLEDIDEYCTLWGKSQAVLARIIC